MSQHTFTTSQHGRTLEIRAGWDRPLQGFFLTVYIASTDEDGSDDDDFLYSNLTDLELLSCGGLPRDFGHFERKLEELELTVPAAMLEQVRQDAHCNAGNRFVRWAADGQVLG
jgi:hypothetical protein